MIRNILIVFLVAINIAFLLDRDILLDEEKKLTKLVYEEYENRKIFSSTVHLKDSTFDCFYVDKEVRVKKGR